MAQKNTMLEKRGVWVTPSLWICVDTCPASACPHAGRGMRSWLPGPCPSSRFTPREMLRFLSSHTWTLGFISARFGMTGSLVAPCSLSSAQQFRGIHTAPKCPNLPFPFLKSRSGQEEGFSLFTHSFNLDPSPQCPLILCAGNRAPVERTIFYFSSGQPGPPTYGYAPVLLEGPF